MSYVRTVWSDRSCTRPRTYSIVINGDSTSTFTPSEGTITAAGTNVTAAVMNNIEVELVALDTYLNNSQNRSVLTNPIFYCL